MAAPWVLLVLAGSLALQHDPPQGESCRSLMREYAAAHRKSKEAARANLPPIPFPDVADYNRRFLRYAETHHDSPDAVDALLWIIEGGLYHHDSEPSLATTVGQAMDRLTADHLGDEKLGPACLQLTNYPSPLRDRFLRTVHQRSPRHSVRGRATLALAEYLTTRAAFVAQHRSEKRNPEEQSRFEKLYGGSDYVKVLWRPIPGQ